MVQRLIVVANSRRMAADCSRLILRSSLGALRSSCKIALDKATKEYLETSELIRRILTVRPPRRFAGPED